jgi:multidrug resistance efflux pump
VRLAEQSLAATVVVAPEGRKIAFMAAAPGVSLAAGDVPVTIVPEKTKDIWVSAFFEPELAAALKVTKECFVVFQEGPKEPVKGFIGAVLPPSGEGKRFAVHVVLDQNEAVVASMIGRDVSVYVVTGKMFFIPGLQKMP